MIDGLVQGSGVRAGSDVEAVGREGPECAIRAGVGVGVRRGPRW